MSTAPALREIPLRSIGYAAGAALGGIALWLLLAATGVERAYPALLLGHEGGVPWILPIDAMMNATFGWLGLYPIDILFWAGALAIAWFVPSTSS